MKTVFVNVTKNPIQINGDIQNYRVSTDKWDLGDPIANGSTLKKALEDFEVNYELKYDIKIKAVVKQTL